LGNIQIPYSAARVFFGFESKKVLRPKLLKRIKLWQAEKVEAEKDLHRLVF